MASRIRSSASALLLQVGGKAAFVADIRVQLLGFEHAFQMVKHFDAGAQGIAEFREAQRHDHEFLHVDGVVGVRAAVDDVHHRRGQQLARPSAEIAIQRQPAKIGRRMGHGQRHAEECALAPRFFLFSVPSISIIRRSMPV